MIIVAGDGKNVFISEAHRRFNGNTVKVKQSLYTPWRRLGGEEL
jgi:hypothetical protein